MLSLQQSDRFIDHGLVSPNFDSSKIVEERSRSQASSYDGETPGLRPNLIVDLAEQTNMRDQPIQEVSQAYSEESSSEYPLQ